MADHSKLLGSASEAIGNTPLIALDRITRGMEGRILAKLEMLNPGFSKKDRPALQIIEDAEADGSLRPGQTVVELTSGNMGTGLAIVCGNKGYPFVAVMSKGNSAERARMMTALASVIDSDDPEEIDQIIAEGIPDPVGTSPSGPSASIRSAGISCSAFSGSR